MSEREVFAGLESPALNLRSLLAHSGPGLILMMTGVGTSHMVTAPVAGGRFGYALLWCIPIAYVFKYYGFEMAFRFTSATGRSMLDAYATAWRSWPLWYVLVTTLIQCVVGQAGRLVAASAVLYFISSEYLGWQIPIAVFASVLGLASVAILLAGSYRVLELAAKVMGGVLLVASVGVYLVQPAPLSALGHFFSIETPAGSWLIVAALLGLLPTGIDVSLQASEWGRAKNVGLGRVRARLERAGIEKAFDPFTSTTADLWIDTSSLPAHVRKYCQRWFQIGLWDFRIGHVISFVIACLFVLLAAVWLFPSPVEGTAVMGEIAKIFTRSVGPWMMIVFLAGAFAATFSTAFNYFDGWPRVVAACSRNLFRATAGLKGVRREDLGPEHRRRWFSEFNIYRGTMLFSLVAAVSIIAGAPRPVWLVLVASTLAFFISPVIFFLNLYYCFSVIPKTDPVFYPTAAGSWMAWGSLVVFSGLTAILIMARVFRIELFGV